MMASTVFIASDFADTFNAAEGFNSPTDAARVLVVIIMLSALWVPGLVIVAVDWAYPRSNGKDVKSKGAEARDRVLAYVESVIPRVFSTQATFTERLWAEILEHHLLFQLFRSMSRKKRREVIGRSLTEFTFMLFLIAAFFDVSNPGDDGSCPGFTSEKSCLRRTSPFDSDQTYCEWVTSGTESTCEYQSQTMTTKALFYLTVLTTIMTSIATIPLDYCFDMLTAPTAQSLEKTRIVSGVKTAVSAMRRLSAAGLQRITPVTKAGRFSFTSNKNKVIANRTISEELTGAADSAQESLTVVMANSTAMTLQFQMQAKRLKSRSQKKMSQLLDAQAPERLAWLPDGDVEMRPPEKVGGNGDAAVEAEDFLREILQQRLYLNDAAEETRTYDAQWCIEKVDGSPRIALDARLGIREGVDFSSDEATRLGAQLSNYSIHHAGLEILHLFMVDLLGRNTAAAKIFQEKFGEEFGHSRVVVLAQKGAAFATLFCLNAFFAYFILLKAFQKGFGWQLQYLVCSVIQFAVELLVFETVECAWLNFWLPEFVLQDVTVAANTLKQQVAQVTAAPDAAKGRSDLESTKYFLNAPAALFVSTKLAKAYPQLLESMIVGSYSTFLPGPMCATWSAAERRRDTMNRSLGFLSRITAALTFAVNIFITIPFIYQRIVIRFVQPMVFSGLSIVWFAAISSPASLAAISALTAGMIAYIVWKRYRTGRTVTADTEVAPPGHSVVIDIVPVPTFIDYDSDGDEDNGGGVEQDDGGSQQCKPEDNQALNVLETKKADLVVEDFHYQDGSDVDSYVSEPSTGGFEHYRSAAPVVDTRQKDAQISETAKGSAQKVHAIDPAVVFDVDAFDGKSDDDDGVEVPPEPQHSERGQERTLLADSSSDGFSALSALSDEDLL
jgi:hypothetical protein